MSAQVNVKGNKNGLVRRIALAGGCLAILGGATAKLVANRNAIETESRAMSTWVERTPVRVVAPEQVTAREVVSSPGTVEPVSEVRILARVAGKMVSAPFDVGAKVGSGTVLATIQADGLEERLAMAQAALGKSRRDRERLESARAYGGVSAQDAELSELSLKQALKEHADVLRERSDQSVKSPLDGCISSRRAELGAYVNPGDELYVVSSCRDVKVVAQASQDDLGRLKPGAKVTVRFDIASDRPLAGKIARIAPKPDQIGSYRVEVAIPQGREVVPQLGATAQVEMEATASAGAWRLEIPRHCLVGSALFPQVFVVRGDSVVLCPIVIGARDGERLVVTAGLSQDDRVVVDGQINIQGGTKVRVLK